MFAWPTVKWSRPMERRSLARRRGPTLVLLALAAMAFVGCGTEPEPEPTSIDVTGPTARLAIGGTVKLTATVQAAGGPLTTAKVTWTSRDSATAKVDATGLATAVRAGETWVVGQAGTVSDSALIEVEFSVSDGGGRMRVRASGRETTLDAMSVGAQIDILGTPDDTLWLAIGANQNQDSLLAAYFLAPPSGQKKAMVEVPPPDTLGPTDPTAAFAYFDIQLRGSIKEIPLRGWVDAAVVQNVPPGTRQGRMRLRMIGSGRAWLGVDGVAGTQWTPTQEAFDVVTDMLPTFLHESVGTSSGQLTGTSRAGSWMFRDASWSRTTAQGRTWVLEVIGPPNIRVYVPGTTPVSVDLGTAAQTTLAYAVVVDSARGYSGTATSGRVEITRYVGPPAADLYGEIRGRVTLNGTGTTQGGAPTPFSGTLTFAAPTSTSPIRSPSAAVVAPSLAEQVRAAARDWLERRRGRLPQR
jgi:hypothetical protein